VLVDAVPALTALLMPRFSRCSDDIAPQSVAMGVPRVGKIRDYTNLNAGSCVQGVGGFVVAKLKAFQD